MIKTTTKGMIASVLRDAVIISGQLSGYETSTEFYNMGRKWNWNTYAAQESYDWIEKRTKRFGVIAQILRDSLIIAAGMEGVKTYSEKQGMEIRYCWCYEASDYAYHWVNSIYLSEKRKEN